MESVVIKACKGCAQSAQFAPEKNGIRLFLKKIISQNDINMDFRNIYSPSIVNDFLSFPCLQLSIAKFGF